MKTTSQKQISRIHTFVAPMLIAVGATLAVAVAPPSSAAVSSCVTHGSVTSCGSPGNTQIATHRPPVTFHPYGDLAGPPLDKD
jgi:hypothetical protein